MPGLGIQDRVGPGVSVSDPGVSLQLNEETHGNMGILLVKANILLEEWYPLAGGGADRGWVLGTVCIHKGL